MTRRPATAREFRAAVRCNPGRVPVERDRAIAEAESRLRGSVAADPDVLDGNVGLAHAVQDAPEAAGPAGGDDAEALRRRLTARRDQLRGELAAVDATSAGALDDLREQAAGCRYCDLWRRATQTVFGEGSAPAAVMLVGEQPGDREDVMGRPFVGPSGRLRDSALEEAGIDRGDVYVTNVVEHFKWRERGKRRIHDTLNEREIGACRPDSPRRSSSCGPG